MIRCFAENKLLIVGPGSGKRLSEFVPGGAPNHVRSLPHPRYPGTAMKTGVLKSLGRLVTSIQFAHLRLRAAPSRSGRSVQYLLHGEDVMELQRVEPLRKGSFFVGQAVQSGC